MVEWPSTLPAPSVSYDFEVKGRALITANDRTYRQARLRDGRKVYLFNVSWELTVSEMATFATFTKTTLSNCRYPFKIQIPTGDGLETHVVKFLDATFSDSVNLGPTYQVNARLICENPPIWDEDLLDEWLGVDPSDFDFILFIDPLTHLVEVFLPSFLSE